MHREFVIVSDRPERLLVDDQNRPHCDDGPFCRWRDGSALYAVHGVRVPAWIVERPQDITVDAIAAEPSVDVRQVMIERYGAARYLSDSGARTVALDGGLRIPGGSVRGLVEAQTGERYMIATDGSTEEVYIIPVEATAQTPEEAHRGIAGFDESRLIAQS
jgi:hypothetical protein